MIKNFLDGDFQKYQSILRKDNPNQVNEFQSYQAKKVEEVNACMVTISKKKNNNKKILLPLPPEASGSYPKTSRPKSELCRAVMRVESDNEYCAGNGLGGGSTRRNIILLI